MVNLSKRMEAIVSLVDSAESVCDVGCDHGFVSIALLERNIVSHAVLMDVNKGPLEHAKENASVYGVSSRAEFILSDGLKKYTKGLSDTLIIAGMGGPLIQRILLESFDKLSDFNSLIFSPQSEIGSFRIFLYENGFTIIDEDMVFEEDKFYQIIKAKRLQNDVMLTKEQAEFGPILLEKKHGILREYLLKEKEKNGILLCKLKSLPPSAQVDTRIAEIQAESDVVNGALLCVEQK